MASAYVRPQQSQQQEPSPMSQRGRQTRAVSLLRCVLAMVTVAVAVLCVSGASRSPATGDGTAVTGYSSSVVVSSADVPSAAGPTADEPALPRPCEKKGLSEPSSARGDLRVPEPSPAGSVDTGSQRGTPLSSPPRHPASGTAPPPGCASSTSTTVLRI
ncbi:hypothetical protein [Streptomyces sp. WG5]|uniref:hypothetical protein n=1 Tax=Streptomyces sp. WG5 TaxID=3417648 RepID=UPI003CF7EA57